MKMKKVNGKYVDDPIHSWFGLSYSNYFTIPRMVLQAMSVEWQERFIQLMDEVNEAGVECPDYHVLRDDKEYTSVKRYDPDDEYSAVSSLHITASDPWANYRHPDYSLLPETLQPDFYKERLKDD